MVRPLHDGEKEDGEVIDRKVDESIDIVQEREKPRAQYTQETRHLSLGLHSAASVDSCLTARFFPRLPLGPPLLPCLSRKVIDEKPFPYFSLADSTRLFSTDVACEDFSRRDGFLFKPSNEASMRWKLCRAGCSHSSGPD
ncbi:hypothetical protein DPX16_22422 [Anabarilius grahami]|uniref:Uncharacterized protein n=1 Tax=Anabarilius grahami TaxID=495550 RepID=A0A3N0YYG6_ANAGA|nr:hypothetical protein DPX16_22422 [Anabarilius grahami]